MDSKEPDKKNSTFVSKEQEVAYKKVFDSVPKHPTMSRLTIFLYLLMRDHLTPGVVASLMVNTFDDGADKKNSPGPCVLSNGYLAQFAEHTASLLQQKLGDTQDVDEPVPTEEAEEDVPAFLRSPGSFSFRSRQKGRRSDD